MNHPANFATIGGRREKAPRRINYELRTTAGTLLATCDTAEPLLRHLDERRGCVVLRVRDGVVVAESPGEVAK